MFKKQLCYIVTTICMRTSSLSLYILLYIFESNNCAMETTIFVSSKLIPNFEQMSFAGFGATNSAPVSFRSCVTDSISATALFTISPSFCWHATDLILTGSFCRSEIKLENSFVLNGVSLL